MTIAPGLVSDIFGILTIDPVPLWLRRFNEWSTSEDALSFLRGWSRGADKFSSPKTPPQVLVS